MATVLYEASEAQVEGHLDETGDLWIDSTELPRVIAWELKEQGLCRADACIPIPGQDAGWLSGDQFNLTAFARHLGCEFVHEDEAVFAFSEPAARGSDSAVSAEAPDFTLPDTDGRFHSLSEYRGKKVLLYAWASY